MTVIQNDIQAAEQKVSAARLAVVATLPSIIRYLFVGALLVGGAYFIHSELVSYRTDLKTADTANKQFQTDLKDFKTQYASDLVKVAAAKAQTTIIERQIASNDDATTQKVSEVTMPAETTSQIQFQAKYAYGELPSITPDLKLAFTPPTVQTMNATKYMLDGAKQDLSGTKEELAIANTQAATFQQLAYTANADLSEARITIGDYKKAAKKRKWAIVADYAVKGAIGVAAFEVGSHIK